jgi:hypothetical protein
MTVPRDEYQEMLTRQVSESNYLVRHIIPTLSKKGGHFFVFFSHSPEVREYHNPLAKWSSEEYGVRACEGNMDPEKLRRHIEDYDNEKCRNFVHRADECRARLKVHANSNYLLRDSYLLRDTSRIVNTSK